MRGPLLPPWARARGEAGQCAPLECPPPSCPSPGFLSPKGCASGNAPRGCACEWDGVFSGHGPVMAGGPSPLAGATVPAPPCSEAAGRGRPFCAEALPLASLPGSRGPFGASTGAFVPDPCSSSS